MLVLTRQVDDVIMIGDTIEINVLEIKGHKVKIGIVAPANLSILRKEIYVKVKEANLAAAQSATDLSSLPALKDPRIENPPSSAPSQHST